MVEVIKKYDKIIAVIIRRSYSREGIEFFTPGDFSQQLGYMNRPKDYEIQPHRHKAVDHRVTLTQEVLFVKSGKVRVDFFDEEQNFLESRTIETGDVILLASGGHGFKMLEASELIEVKQGPYSGDDDKIQFNNTHGERSEE